MALLTLGLGIGVSVLLSLLLTDEEAGTGPDSTFVWLLLVVLLTTPLQSAAEEYLCRGYLSQAIAGWVRHPTVGAIVAGLVSALVFSALHGPQDAVTFLDRFAFGLAASAVVWLTGGLEAAIVLHAVNNVIVFVLAGALGDEPATEAYPGGLGPAVPAAQPAVDGRLRGARGALPAAAPPGAAHRGTGPAACPSWPHRPRRGDPPGPGWCDPGLGRRVSSSAAPRGAAHGVWGNWQPDGFWFR